MTDKFHTNVMPHAIVAHTPDEALQSGLWWLKVAGEMGGSRNGRVLVAPAPVITAYPRPDYRVMASPLRDANPFFHLFESLWMLAGLNDVAKVATYAKQMEAFADDGLLWGAYGFRWRHFFSFDQLKEIIRLLKRDPTTRRAVLTMWSPSGDLVTSEGVGGISSKDVPCNTHIYFDGTRGVLNMTVSNRSNDAVWGAYGANLVHMSVLHEFVACAAGLPLGTYYQFSNNFHIYPDRPDVRRLMGTEGDDRNQWAVHFQQDQGIYGAGLEPYPLMSVGGNWEMWLHECEEFVENPLGGIGSHHHSFFSNVAWPLMVSHAEFRRGDFKAAIDMAKACQAQDWSHAAVEWLERRQQNTASMQAAARRLMEGQ